VDDSWDYFLSIRPWFFGGVLLVWSNLLTVYEQGVLGGW